MNVREDVYSFHNASDPPVYTSRDGGPWVQRTVETGGTPLVVASGGFMTVLCTNTLEAQLACLYMADTLPYDIDDLHSVDFWLKLSTATLHAAIDVAFGMASAYNADPDSLTAAALFRCYGSNAVLCETDDGTNDNDDVAAGLNLSTTVKRFQINFAEGIKTQVPPPSVGGKASVLFNMDDDNGNLRPVARATRFDMSNYSAGLQPFFMVRKNTASSVVDTAALATLSIERLIVRYKAP